MLTSFAANWCLATSFLFYYNTHRAYNISTCTKTMKVRISKKFQFIITHYFSVLHSLLLSWTVNLAKPHCTSYYDVHVFYCDVILLKILICKGPIERWQNWVDAHDRGDKGHVPGLICERDTYHLLLVSKCPLKTYRSVLGSLPKLNIRCLYSALLFVYWYR